MSIRNKQVAELVQHQLSKLIQREINDPRLRGLSIIAIDLSPDMRNAKIFYAVLNNDDVPAAEKALAKATGFLRKQLAKTTALRYVPRLQFVHDELIERAEHMIRLIEDVTPPEEKTDGEA